MLNRPHYIALSVVLSTVLIVLNLSTSSASKVKLAFGTLFIPLFGLTSSAHALVERGGGLLVSRRTLAQQLDQSQRDNEQLRIMAMQGQEALKENEHLRQLLALKSLPPWKFKAARVVGRDPTSWW